MISQPASNHSMSERHTTKRCDQEKMSGKFQMSTGNYDQSQPEVFKTNMQQAVRCAEPTTVI
jgi:hypothetical protein